MSPSAEELNELSYRELQQECKSQGINAKGTKLELLGRLLQHYKVQSTPGSTYKTPSSTIREPRRGAVASPSQPSPARRKSVDEKTIRKAISTPLPVSPPLKTPKAQRGGRAGKSSSKRSLATVAAVVIAVLAMGVAYCQTHKSCPAAAQQASDIARTNGDWAVQQASNLAYQAQQAAVQAKNNGAAIIADFTSKITGSSGSGDNSGSAGSSPSFNGRLNKNAVAPILDALPSSGDEEWDNAKEALVDIWAGQRLQENKANVVLFAAASAEGCDTVAEAVHAAVPSSSALLSFPAGSISSNKGELQKQLAEFLQRQPRGVILLEGIDVVDVNVVPVLVNVLGEFGALTDNGVHVDASGATFYLTMIAPSEIMAEESEPSFKTGAKVALSSALLEQLGDEENEAVTANVRSLRRRIDLVMKVQQ